MKYFLCFWVGDGGDNESYNVYYSSLVIARNKSEALKKYFKEVKSDVDEDSKKYYKTLEMKNVIQ